MPESFVATESHSLSPNAAHVRITYFDVTTRYFLVATILWGFLTCLLGILTGLLLSWPALFSRLRDDLLPYLTFARLNTLQTNAATFAFGANAVFTGIYYSVQRLCKTRLWSAGLSIVHFIAWQTILILMMGFLMMGYTRGSLISGVPWPLEIAFVLVWLFVFGLNIFMTIIRRRERYLFVSLWFYLASIIAVGIFAAVNWIVFPRGWWQSSRVFTGVQDAWLQNWYKHGIDSFLLTIPFLGLVYYFLPKAAGRPLYSYKLSIIHFWSMIVLLACASSRQLHFTPIPEWASTLGMLCGLAMWMPSWAGVVNGLGTLSGNWNALKKDPALRFMVVGLLIYAYTSLERSILSIKSIDALTHYSDWMIAHSHAVEMGWQAFMTFGMIYWLLPRLVRIADINIRFGHFHFWIATVGLILIVVPEYLSGFAQSRKWRELSELGRLQFSFMEALQSASSFWSIRVAGNCIYAFGIMVLAANVLLALRFKPMLNEVNVGSSESESQLTSESRSFVSKLLGKPVLAIASKLDQLTMLHWHRDLERQPIWFAICISFIFGLLTILQLFPLLAFKGYSTIATIEPYTPLELVGRDIYIAQGCQNCHSQMIRPIVHEAQRYGAISQAGEFIFDRPAQWGDRRIGPDLAREGGGKQSSLWHWKHFENASVMTPETVMPVYKHLLSQKLPFEDIGKRVQAEQIVGAPYDLNVQEGETIDSKFAVVARKQAEMIAADIIGQGGPVIYRKNLIKDTSAIALIAYIQRLGTDLTRLTPSPAAAVSPSK